MGIRRKARIVALKALFEMDIAGHNPEESLARHLEEGPLTPGGALFARELVVGVVGNRDRIDDTIRSYAPAWPIEQIAAIDKNILRVAIFEILLNNKVPEKAVINEAVELAKTFGSESSPKFVNGVLGSVLRSITDKEGGKYGQGL